MSDEQKFPLAVALQVGATLKRLLAPGVALGFCEIAGSARRGKAEVGDLEMVYVPLKVQRRAPGEMFESEQDGAAIILEGLLKERFIEKRKNVEGNETWGPQIKLARHVATGLPLDFFSTSEASWWNYLVCRTGPAENNQAIAAAARQRGWKWEPYSSGFSRLQELQKLHGLPGEEPERHAVQSEREVFEFVGLNYVAPGLR